MTCDVGFILSNYTLKTIHVQRATRFPVLFQNRHECLHLCLSCCRHRNAECKNEQQQIKSRAKMTSQTRTRTRNKEKAIKTIKAIKKTSTTHKQATGEAAGCSNCSSSVFILRVDPAVRLATVIRYVM